MAYHKDGQYCYDNLIGERSIRPLTIECKDKMTFDSRKSKKMNTSFYFIVYANA